MRIGIISDSHDNVWRLDEAIQHLKTVDLVLHCGDLISPFMVHRLAKGLASIPIHTVWGNNDGDKLTVARIAQNYPAFTIHGEFAELEIDGCRIAINHYPEIARGLAHSGKYDLVCYGHDHTAFEDQIGQTILLNPGEVMGMNGRSTLAFFDIKMRRVEFIEFWSENS
jgi:putative phosphoesterase